MDQRQRRLMELSRTGENRIEGAPSGEGWVSGRAVTRSCGDDITIYLRLEDHRIVEARYTGAGCALALASAEKVTRSLSGLPEEVGWTLILDLYRYLGGEERERSGSADERSALWKAFEDLSLVREFPARTRCVLLSFEAAISALQGGQSDGNYS